MQTQRDHVHAHTFMMGRLSSALVEGDPTGAEIPGRRAQTGLLIGVIVLVLVVGGFAVYGWISPGGSRAYRQAGVILVEKETGNRYVFREGVLHQVPDLTSAMLLQGPRATIKLISRKSLKDLPRGVPLGVRGAPQQMPAADQLVAGPWLVCLPGPLQPGAATSLRMGVNLDPGAPATVVPGDRFLVVRGQNGATYLIAGHGKYRVTDDAVLVSLGAAAINPPSAPAMWLDWLPEGQALGPARIPGAGRTGPSVGGRSYPVGTLFRQGAGQLFVLRRDGLAPLSRTEFLIADAADRSAPVDLDPADVVGTQRSADRSLLNRLPDLASMRLQDTAGQSVCQRHTPFRDDFARVVALAPPWAAGVFSDGSTLVQARRGAGMAVTPVPVPAASRTKEKKIAFISEEGVSYRLADAGTAASLKLTRAPVPFPRELLAALPQGPVLSSKAVTAQTRG